MRKMMTMGAAALAVLGMAPATATAQDSELTVAYFLEWPMPFQYAKVNGTYDEELGLKVNWRSFDTGTAMSAAMASGDVHLAVSQGVPPFVVATSAGQDLQVVDVAVSYSENDNCVVRADLEIDKDSASELAGKKVAVPIGTAAHYGFLKQIEHFGVDPASMDIVDMSPPDGAAAIAQGAVDMACGYGGGLSRMKEHGNVLLTGAEKEELGIQVFDVTSAPAEFVANNPDLVAKFLAVTAKANREWNEGGKQEEMIPVIARDAGMEEGAVRDFMATFAFLPVETQLSEKWLGDGTQKFLKEVADFFVEQGQIPQARDSYDSAVNTGPLTAARDAGM